MTDLLRIPFDRPLLGALAAGLLEREGEALPRATVLLPSTRAVRSLRHTLLETSGREALVLPEITTPGLLIHDLAARLGIDRRPFPTALRAEWLAQRLVDLPWLEKNPESAPGLAAELVSLFDEMRRYDLDPADPSTSGAADQLMDDVDQVRDAWARYRLVTDWDDVDLEMSVTDAAESAARNPGVWPGRPVSSLWIAGFVDLPPLRARLLRAMASHASRTVLAFSETAAAGGAASFLASFGDADSPLHPAAPPRSVIAALAPDVLDAVPDAAPVPLDAAPGLLPCANPEDESRRIAALVVERLAADPGASVAVATADGSLARRVVAQLRDAGLDLDDSGGVPLSATPTGSLIWLLARCAVTGPSHEPLLELLTHPMTSFGRDFGDHHTRTRRFESDLLRGRTAPGSLDGYRARATERDAKLQEALPGAEPEMTGLVDDIARALAPLLAIVRGEHAVADILGALRSAWALTAPHYPLPSDEESAPEGPRAPDADRLALAGLLDQLAWAAPTAPKMTLVDTAAVLTRLLGAETVRPHRAENLPVQVTGLLEARLESFDLLILGGMTEDRFPGRVGRPLYLGRAWRESAGLPDWRRTMGQQAELFARLLHAGETVALTWPNEVDGQPTLPSPFVQRMMLAGYQATAPEARPALYRRAPEPGAAAVAPPAAVSDAAPTAEAPTRRLTSISPSALATYRSCPYRWLLEKGFGLGEEDKVQEALESRDQGTIVHDCMAEFLVPEGAGVLALAAGRMDEARRLLEEIAEERFSHHAGDLPQRRIWEASFLAGAEAILKFEQRRITTWRPAAVETRFEVSLGALSDWLGHDCGLDAAERAVLLKGRLDRVDTARDGSPICSVIDYKSGKVPSNRDVTDGVDLQLAAYALAVILGGVEGLPDGAVVAGGAFYTLKGDEPGFKKMLPLDDLARDAEAVLVTARAMIRADGPFPLVPDEAAHREPAPCRFCHLRGVCRLDERDRAPLEEVSP